MQVIPTFKVNIEDGKLSFQDKEKYEGYLTSLFPGEYELIVRKPKKVRSSRANRYYWGVVLKLIAEHTGEDMEDLHNHFSFKHLGYSGKSGKLVSRRSTAMLSKEEFTEYMDKVMLWAMQYLEITFPDPEAVDYQFINY